MMSTIAILRSRIIVVVLLWGSTTMNIMVRGEGYYIPCYICGGDPTAVITNPSGYVDFYGSCDKVYNLGLIQDFDAERECIEIKYEKDTYEICGCRSQPIGDVCHVCKGNPNMIMENPFEYFVDVEDYHLTVPYNPRPINETCDFVMSMGLFGGLTSSQCEAISNNDEIYQTCGCISHNWFKWYLVNARTSLDITPVQSGQVLLYPNVTRLSMRVVSDLRNIATIEFQWKPRDKLNNRFYHRHTERMSPYYMNGNVRDFVNPVNYLRTRGNKTMQVTAKDSAGNILGTDQISFFLN
jgi:hypothetical protein